MLVLLLNTDLTFLLPVLFFLIKLAVLFQHILYDTLAFYSFMHLDLQHVYCLSVVPCVPKNVHLDFWHVKLQLRLAAAACCYIGCISVQLVYTTDHVLKQKVVTLNTCCDIACLTFQLPHITTGFFQSHRQPTTGSF